MQQVFEKSTKNLSFGEATTLLKQGKMVSRKGWNGKNMFIFMQIPSTITKDVVSKMQSLPDAVKAEFDRRFNNSNYQIEAIYYNNQLAMVNSSNVITGWSPSTIDSLSEDWELYTEV